MSTDHPNGASFLAYPQIIALLMDRTRRQDYLNRLPARLRDATVLGQLERQYSLYEIAIITRAAPARMLGLTRKGHLGPGADADITIYTPDADYERMFELPRFVLKAGEILIEQGEMRKCVEGTTLQTAPNFDAGALPSIRQWFDSRYSIQFRNYSIDADEYADTFVEPTVGRP